MGLAPTGSTITSIMLLILISFHSEKISSQSMELQQSRRIPSLGSAGAWAMHDSRGTYRETGVGVDLILGCYSEASVTVSCCPGEIHSSLQLFVHLLINGATKLCPIISANKHSKMPSRPGRQAGAGQGCPRLTGQGCCKWTELIQSRHQMTGSLTGVEQTPEVGRLRGRREGYFSHPWEQPKAAQSTTQAAWKVKLASKIFFKKNATTRALGFTILNDFFLLLLMLLCLK